MKKFLCISFAFGLMFGSIGVTCADTGAKKVPKIEKSCDYDLCDLSSVVMIADESYVFQNGAVPMFMATLSDVVLVPEGSITYLKRTKPAYLSPDIDRKWVWWYSLAFNL